MVPCLFTASLFDDPLSPSRVLFFLQLLFFLVSGKLCEQASKMCIEALVPLNLLSQVPCSFGWHSSITFAGRVHVLGTVWRSTYG